MLTRLYGDWGHLTASATLHRNDVEGEVQMRTMRPADIAKAIHDAPDVISITIYLMLATLLLSSLT